MIRPSALAMLLVVLLGVGVMSAPALRVRLGGPQDVGGQDASKAAVAREWKGSVRSPKAEEYYSYLFEGVKKLRATRGNLGVQILRRRDGDAVEFTVVSYWESREAIKAYAGEDIEKPRHLPKDREYLIELPKKVLHYDVDYSDWGGRRGQ